MQTQLSNLMTCTASIQHYRYVRWLLRHKIDLMSDVQSNSPLISDLVDWDVQLLWLNKVFAAAVFIRSCLPKPFRSVYKILSELQNFLLSPRHQGMKSIDDTLKWSVDCNQIIIPIISVCNVLPTPLSLSVVHPNQMMTEKFESRRWHNKICLQCDGAGCNGELRWFWYSDCSVIHETREQITDSAWQTRTRRYVASPDHGPSLKYPEATDDFTPITLPHGHICSLLKIWIF